MRLTCSVTLDALSFADAASKLDRLAGILPRGSLGHVTLFNIHNADTAPLTELLSPREGAQPEVAENAGSVEPCTHSQGDPAVAEAGADMDVQPSEAPALDVPSVEALRLLCKEKMQTVAGARDTIAALLKTHGVDGITGVPDDKRAAFYLAVSTLA